jgi:hypothetical protein
MPLTHDENQAHTMTNGHGAAEKLKDQESCGKPSRLGLELIAVEFN